MDLALYLEKHNISQKKMAQRSGLSEAAIQHYVSGRRLPTLRAAEKLVAASNGEVLYLDLIRYWDLKNEKRLS